MIDLLHRATLFALYQFTVIAGIVLLPLAVLARHGGITLPLDRVIHRLGRAYENAQHRRA